MSKPRLRTIIKKNVQFASQIRKTHQGHTVCVFAGAMRGIGARMLERMVMVSYHLTVFYILWNPHEPSGAYRKGVLRALLNRSCKIVFIDADVSQISDMDSASKQILAAEEKVDYLCMSNNDAPVDGVTDTSEDGKIFVDTWIHSRIRLLSNLLPLLRKSQRPRVLNILNYGFPVPNDKNHGGHRTKLQHACTITNIVFNHLTKENPEITFIVSPIGLDNPESSQDAEASETESAFLKT